MPRLTPLLALPILLGCASATQTYAPDGRAAHAVDCGGLWRDWGACMERAGATCPRGCWPCCNWLAPL